MGRKNACMVLQRQKDHLASTAWPPVSSLSRYKPTCTAVNNVPEPICLLNWSRAVVRTVSFCGDGEQKETERASKQASRKEGGKVSK